MTSPQPQTEFEDNVLQTQVPALPEVPPPRQQSRWLWLLLALLALTGGGVVLWRLLTPAENQAPAIANVQAVPVKLSTVKAGLIEDSSDYIANLESRRSVTLQPRIQGQVAQIFVKSGDLVKTGDPIIQIDAREQQAAVSSVNAAADAARSQLANAQATLRSLEAEKLSYIADVRLYQQEYERYANLSAQGAVSRQTRDQYANRLATARANLRAIESKIQAQQASVSQAANSLEQALANSREQKVQLQYYTITAPFTGTVGEIPAKIGDFVNTSTQLATITQNQPLEVDISVPVERASKLREGTVVELIDTQGRVLGSSRVFFVSPKARNENRMIQVKALFNNAKNQLRADEYVRARMIFSQRPGVIIPTTAVARIAGQNFVYVAQTQESSQEQSQLVAKQKLVRLGNIKGNNYQVLEGLEPGERIIISGLLNLRDGVPINPEATSPEF